MKFVVTKKVTKMSAIVIFLCDPITELNCLVSERLRYELYDAMVLINIPVRTYRV